MNHSTIMKYNNTVICNAIKSKQIIHFNYEDKTRIVEPYCFGESSKGNQVLRGFQIKGDSKSGDSHGWKLFNVSKMENVAINREHFSLGHDYKEEKRMKNIYCCV